MVPLKFLPPVFTRGFCSENIPIVNIGPEYKESFSDNYTTNAVTLTLAGFFHNLAFILFCPKGFLIAVLNANIAQNI